MIPQLHTLGAMSLTFLLTSVCPAEAQEPRARDLGLRFYDETGALNAITDVDGVEVGHCALISGDGTSTAGEGPVRTGVKAIFPRGKKFNPVYANWYGLNGNGEMTGTTWVTESGFLETPVMITNTNSVGVVRDRILKWYVEINWYEDQDWWYHNCPVVGEAYDRFLDDIYGFHVEKEHVLQAINDAKSGPVVEGNVGGGTGMMCLGFKDGTGTSSRVVDLPGNSYPIGLLVQTNFGGCHKLTIAGAPVGQELMDTLPTEFKGPPKSRREEGDGSIIVIVATDAPLLSHQLKPIAQRIPQGIALVGDCGSNRFGDIFLAFSTAKSNAFNDDEHINVEEAIINAMVAAETMRGHHGNKIYALPQERFIEKLRKHNRLN